MDSCQKTRSSQIVQGLQTSWGFPQRKNRKWTDLTAAVNKQVKDDLDRKEEEMRELERDSIAGRRTHENKRKEEKKEDKGNGKAPELIKISNDDKDAVGEEEDNPIDVDNLNFLFKQSLDKRETDQSKVLQALDKLHQDNLELKKIRRELVEALKNINK
ncbi:hypothetical protein BDF21DRAFT_451197 [Thamnidium elegans]|nr:hypothetical protein BDF21DRAFT_451197 [Thamnidium elegans]